MQRKTFYDVVRPQLGSLSQSVVDGFETILDEAERRRTPVNDLAYILATAWWETARTMQPVRKAFFVAPDDSARAELWRKQNLRYYPYYTNLR